MAPGLYFHVPFCATVCPYCDFAVLVGGEERRASFVGALVREIELWSGEVPEELAGFDTVYLGGGTPSMLAAGQLARILAAARERLDVVPDPWIFLEANPEDVTSESVRAWRDLGVRFLSLGVQSFDDSELRFLGRLHDARRAREAVELALGAGFATVSLDLIYGLPGQTEAGWRSNLETAVELGPDHLSCYQLTVEDRTVFGVRKRRGELTELPEADQANRFLLTYRLLADRGYPGYEVSNFARTPEHRSRHNMKYWDHTPYLGLGPSAHSFAGRRRWWNRRSLSSWQRAVERGERPVADSEDLDHTTLALERLMLALRTPAGLDLEELQRSYGIEPSPALATAIERLVKTGKLIDDRGTLQPTLAGLATADALANTLSASIERSG